LEHLSKNYFTIYLEDTKVLPKCLLCESNVNWNEKDFKYRETCSSKCSGELDLVRNSPIFINHAKLESKEDYYNYFISRCLVSSILIHCMVLLLYHTVHLNQILVGPVRI
jgi:hypothetical protein